MSEQSIVVTDFRQPEVEYRPILGFPGYRVGSDGSVWSCRHKSGLLERWRRLKHLKNTGGYLQVFLSAEGNVYPKVISRLVLECFVGPCPDGMEACHFPDRNKENNSLCNLRWGTHKENIADKAIHGTQLLGTAHPFAKLCEEDVRRIRLMSTDGLSSIKIASIIGISSGVVRRILRGEAWGHVV